MVRHGLWTVPRDRMHKTYNSVCATKCLLKVHKRSKSTSGNVFSRVFNRVPEWCFEIVFQDCSSELCSESCFEIVLQVFVSKSCFKIVFQNLASRIVLQNRVSKSCFEIVFQDCASKVVLRNRASLNLYFDLPSLQVRSLSGFVLTRETENNKPSGATGLHSMTANSPRQRTKCLYDGELATTAITAMWSEVYIK